MDNVRKRESGNEGCCARGRLRGPAGMFFNRPDFDLLSAQPPNLALCHNGARVDDLGKTYRAMSAMIFGEPPAFDAVIEAIAARETQLNAQGGQG